MSNEYEQPLGVIEPIPKEDQPAYERLIELATQAQTHIQTQTQTQTQTLLYSPESTKSDGGARRIHREWQSVQPIIAKANNLLREGSKNLYVTHVPDVVLQFVEAVATLVDRGMTEAQPDLDQAISILDTYQERSSIKLANSLPQLATDHDRLGLNALHALSAMAKYSKDTQVRANALNAMGQAVSKIAEGATSPQCTNQYEYIPYLLQLLDHQDEAVQKQARYYKQEEEISPPIKSRLLSNKSSSASSRTCIYGVYKRRIRNIWFTGRLSHASLAYRYKYI